MHLNCPMSLQHLSLFPYKLVADKCSVTIPMTQRAPDRQVKAHIQLFSLHGTANATNQDTHQKMSLELSERESLP